MTDGLDAGIYLAIGAAVAAALCATYFLLLEKRFAAKYGGGDGFSPNRIVICYLFLTGMFTLTMAKYGISQTGTGYTVMLGILSIAAMADIKWNKIPNAVTLFGFFGAVAYRLLAYMGYSGADIFIDGVLGVLLCCAPLIMAYIITRGKMGIGDIKLMGVIGAWLGVQLGAFAFSLTFITAALVLIGLMAFKKAGLKSKVPLGPFMLLGTFLSIIFGGLFGL